MSTLPISQVFQNLPAGDLTLAEEKALAALDMPGLVATLQELIAVPSVTGSTAESAAQRWLAGRYEANNIQTDLWPVDLASTTSDPEFPGIEAPREEAWGLAGLWGGANGPTLVLNGHIDVVPPGDLDQWDNRDPYQGKVDGQNLYGRGACDMKGGLICNLFAVKAIQAAGLRLKGRVLLESVVSEEDGGLGTFATLRRGYRGDAAIITEPTRLEIIPACAGALTFRLRLTGRSTHASVRQEGISTIEKFWKVWKALDELEFRRNLQPHPLMKRYDLPYPLSIGTMQAGDWPSSVPDQLVAEGRLGVALGESPEQARAEFEAALVEVNKRDIWLCEHPVEVEWYGGQFASGQLPENHPLVELVANHHRLLYGETPQVYGAPYGSDLRLMVGLGNIPTLHYGPGDVKKAHAPNEFVPLDELEKCTRTLILTILRFCGYE